MWLGVGRQPKCEEQLVAVGCVVMDQLVATQNNYNLMSSLGGKVTARDRRIDERMSQKLPSVHFSKHMKNYLKNCTQHW